MEKESQGWGGGVKKEGNYSGSQTECVCQRAEGESGGERPADGFNSKKEGVGGGSHIDERRRCSFIGAGSEVAMEA